MKIKTKILLDRIIGAPICFFLNPFARLLGVILKRNHQYEPEYVKKIVIQKLLGMGSILRATPVIRAIRKHYPKAEIIFVTTIGNIALLKRLPNIDKIFYVNDKSFWALLSSTLKLLKMLWKEKIDLYFDLEVYSSYTTFIETLSCARNRYGFYRKSTGFRKGLHTKLVFFNTHRYISEVYAQLVGTCRVKVNDMTMDRISILGADKEEFENWARLNIKKRKYLVINPNCSDLMLERRWPTDYLVNFINQFANLVPDKISIVLMGAQPERGYVSDLYDRLSEKAKKITSNAAGVLSLGATFALIDSAFLMITVDSGPYHFAASLGTPTLSMWGPGDPSHYSLKEPHEMIVYKSVYCSPCLYYADEAPCEGNNICMKMIQPFEVLALTLKFLGIDAAIETVDNLGVNHRDLGIVTR